MTDQLQDALALVAALAEAARAVLALMQQLK